MTSYSLKPPALLTSTWAKSCSQSLTWTPGVVHTPSVWSPQLHRLLQSPPPACPGTHTTSGPHHHEVLHQPSPPKDNVNYNTMGKQTYVTPALSGTKLPAIIHSWCLSTPSVILLPCSKCSSPSLGPCQPASEQGPQPPTPAESSGCQTAHRVL